MENIIIDALKMTPEQLYELNKNIARLHQKGKTTGEIAEATGAKTRKIQMVVKAYREGGAAALKPKQLGRPKGRGTKLSAEQTQEIRKIITDKAPEQLKLKGFLWDLKNISNLIWARYGIRMPYSTMSDYLARWVYAAAPDYL